MAVCSDECTCIVRTESGLVGYYDGRCLMTEEALYEQFLEEEKERQRANELGEKVRSIFPFSFVVCFCHFSFLSCNVFILSTISSDFRSGQG